MTRLFHRYAFAQFLLPMGRPSLPIRGFEAKKRISLSGSCRKRGKLKGFFDP